MSNIEKIETETETYIITSIIHYNYVYHTSFNIEMKVSADQYAIVNS